MITGSVLERRSRRVGVALGARLEPLAAVVRAEVDGASVVRLERAWMCLLHLHATDRVLGVRRASAEPGAVAIEGVDAGEGDQGHDVEHRGVVPTPYVAADHPVAGGVGGRLAAG